MQSKPEDDFKIYQGVFVDFALFFPKFCIDFFERHGMFFLD